MWQEVGKKTKRQNSGIWHAYVVEDNGAVPDKALSIMYLEILVIVGKGPST